MEIEVAFHLYIRVSNNHLVDRLALLERRGGEAGRIDVES